MNAGPLPGPPADLWRRKINLLEFGDSFFRTHALNRSPLFFGKKCTNRFDAPDRAFGVLYCGRDPFCAFIETFTHTAGTRIITTTELEKRALSELRAERPLRLVDLTNSGSLMRIGADARLFSGEHDIAQQWSKALHDLALHPDGLLYPRRLDPVRHALAIFEDRAPKIITLRRETWYASGQMRSRLVDLVEHYKLELIENRFVSPRKPVTPARQPRLFD